MSIKFSPLEHLDFPRIDPGETASDGTVVDYRRYEAPIGLVPSVTSINKALEGPGAETGIARWALQYPRTAAVVSENGTLNHEAIEAYIKTGHWPDQSPRQFDIMCDLQDEGSDIVAWGYRESFRHIEPLIEEVLLCEAQLYHPWGFAGSMDCLARFKDGRLVGMDWKSAYKTKNKIYPKPGYLMQAAAYGLATHHLYDIVLDGAMVVTLSPVGRPPHIVPLDRPKLRKQALLFRDACDLFYDSH